MSRNRRSQLHNCSYLWWAIHGFSEEGTGPFDRSYFDASRRGQKEGLKSPRDQTESAYSTVMGTGEKCLISDPGSESRFGREKEKEEVRRK